MALFGTFFKKIKETIDLAEVAGCSYTPEQIVAKAFNYILKSQSLPDTAIRD